VNYHFKDQALLETALTHTSWAYENGGEHNERLEFLGDAVLQLCSTEILYRFFPDDREGVLHGYRTQLVSTDHLAQIAKRWKLDQKAKLGKGEEATGGREKPRLLAGLFEAVLGAIYLDAGLDSVMTVIQEALHGDLAGLQSNSDPRVVLHEWAQQEHGVPPEYSVIREEGPPHEKTFTVAVCTPNGVIGEGKGRSKKVGCITAAQAAVEKLGLKS